MALTQVKQILEILRLRSGPQALPFSYGLLAILLVLHLLVDILLSGQDGLQLNNLFSAVVNTLFTAGFVFAILQWTKKSARFVQTLSALLGVEIMIGLIGGVLLLIYQVPALAIVVSVLYLVLIIWNGLVAAHIFHLALDTSMLWGVALALLYIVLSYNVLIGFSTIGAGA